MNFVESLRTAPPGAIDFGYFWTDSAHPYRHYHVMWDKATGELSAKFHGSLSSKAESETLAILDYRWEVEGYMKDWPDVLHEPNSLHLLRKRLEQPLTARCLHCATYGYRWQMSEPEASDLREVIARETGFFGALVRHHLQIAEYNFAQAVGGKYESFSVKAWENEDVPGPPKWALDIDIYYRPW